MDKVIITDEAVKDSELSGNIGTVVEFFDEPLPNSEPTKLVRVKLDNSGEIVVVGAHEVELYNEWMKKGLSNITKEEVLYDLGRNYSHAKQVHDGDLDGYGLSKEGAFRRMQVYNYAIKNL